jgi:hypothetical protein
LLFLIFRKSEQNKKIMEDYIKFTDIYSIKSLREILTQVRDEIQISLNKIIKSDEDCENEFNEEVKKLKPLDIVKSYREFLQQKRSRPIV